MPAIVFLLFLAQAVPSNTSNNQAKPQLASIEGIVRTAVTGAPVFKARIQLVGGSPNSPSSPKSALTDRYGRFSFSDLQAGSYILNAFANSYVRQAYGQKVQTGPATPVVVAAGQQVKDIVFEMVPTGTITGRIYDFDNMPLPNADVVLQKLGYDGNGQRTLQAVQQVRTNDLGEYRLFWVSPGKYFLRVEFTGSPTPIFRNPNDYLGPVEEGYVPVYYPGSTDASTANELELLPGGQISAIDVTMLRTKTYTIRGRVIVAGPMTPGQRPFVSLRPRQSGSMSGGSSINTNMNPADNTFEMRNVPSGSYVLQANLGNSQTGTMRAEKPIEVNQDLDGVVVTLSPGFDLHGRVIFESRPPETGPGSVALTSMRTMLRPAGDSSLGFFAGPTGPPILKPDGTFTITQVMPGTYQISIAPLPQDFYIKAVTLGQGDALRDGFTVERAPDEAIQILVGANAGKLEGTVVDKDGKPVNGAPVTLIPGEPNHPERYKYSVTDTTGHFSLRGIFPGAYKLFAWESLEPNAYRDPELIRRFDNQGKVVVITEGGNPSVELRVIKQ